MVTSSFPYREAADIADARPIIHLTTGLPVRFTRTFRV
jgi:hypothetical protein